MKFSKIFLLIFLWASFFILKNIHAVESKVSIGSIANVIGKVEIIRDGKSTKAEKEYPIYETDTLLTHKNSAIKINFKDGSNYMGFSDTQFKISEYKIKTNKNGGTNLQSTVDLVKGSIRSFVKPKEDGFNDSKFSTPNSVMLIRGTLFAQTENSNLMLDGGGSVRPNINDIKEVSLTTGKKLENGSYKVIDIPQDEIKNIQQQAEHVNKGALPNTYVPEQRTDKQSGDKNKSDDSPTGGTQGNNATTPTSSTAMTISPDGTSTTSAMSGAADGIKQSISSTGPAPAPKVDAAAANAASVSQSTHNVVTNSFGPGSTVTAAVNNSPPQQEVAKDKINPSSAKINIHINPAPPPAK